MKQRGFILVLTLLILATITIAASFFAQRIASSIDLARRYDNRIQSLIACSNSQAEIAYLLSTRGMTVNALGDPATQMRLDNRPYRMDGNCIARLQDARGLYLINAVNRDSLAPLLRYKGVPENQIDLLYDNLVDYIDPDSQLHRLNSISKKEYLEKGLPVPTGNPLVTPEQLRQVYGWQAQSQLWNTQEAFSDLISTASVIALNPNTAPPAVLMSIPGMTETLLPKIIEYRNIEPILNEGQLAALLGIDPQLLFLKIIAYPADTLRVSLGADGDESSIRYNIALTPLAADAPWRIDYYYRIPQRIRADNNDDIPSNPFDLKAKPASTETGLPFLDSATQ